MTSCLTSSLSSVVSRPRNSILSEREPEWFRLASMLNRANSLRPNVQSNCEKFFSMSDSNPPFHTSPAGSLPSGPEVSRNREIIRSDERVQNSGALKRSEPRVAINAAKDVSRFRYLRLFDEELRKLKPSFCVVARNGLYCLDAAARSSPYQIESRWKKSFVGINGYPELINRV